MQLTSVMVEDMTDDDWAAIQASRPTPEELANDRWADDPAS
jgi:phenylpyruvate tautomerase PptA (4-oxalocrotonate tautomerase family)